MLRYAPIIRFFAYVTVAFGVLITGIDSIEDMPTYFYGKEESRSQNIKCQKPITLLMILEMYSH